MNSTIRRAWFRLDRHDDDPAVPDPAGPATEPEDEPDPQPDDTPKDDTPLGPKGLKALDVMKAERAEAKREAAAAKKEAAALAKKVADFEDRDKSDLDKATAKAEKATALAEAATKRAVLAEVKAAAAEFVDPGDAAAFLDLTQYAGDDGEIDTESIRSDLDALLEKKPHLRKAPAAPDPLKVPKPDPGQGARQPAPPADYRTASRDDLNAQLAEVAPGFRLR